MSLKFIDSHFSWEFFVNIFLSKFCNIILSEIVAVSHELLLLVSVLLSLVQQDKNQNKYKNQNKDEEKIKYNNQNK